MNEQEIYVDNDLLGATDFISFSNWRKIRFF